MKMNVYREQNMKMNARIKSPWDKEKTLIIQDEKGKETSFFPSFVQNVLNPFSVSESLDSKSVTSMNSSLFSHTKGKNSSRIDLSWTLEMEKARKVDSAKKILKDLNQHYENIFKEYDDNVPEKQIFLHSNILYLIAATDGNEDTLGHSQLVASYTMMLSKALGVEDKNHLVNIERGALLHDIGKIGIPESILRKAGPLTALEREIVKEHPFIGYEIIEGFEFLKKAAQVVLFHHESYDGSGYPYGLAGEEIPLEARIFAVADTLDAITSDRPYRKGSNFDVAFSEIERVRGTQFDPVVVDTLFSVPLEKWQRIKEHTEKSLHLYTIH